MIKQFLGLFLALACLLPLRINAQDTTSLTDTTAVFPQTWAGEWSGDLKIYTSKGLSQALPMALHILPIEGTSNFTWTLIYGEGEKADKRLYELQPVDREKGIFVIDEKNSIKIEGYYIEGKFYSRFEVMNNLLLIAVEKEGEQLDFEIISGKLEPASVTGNQVVEGEEIPEVKTYPVGVRQRAILHKKSKSINN